MRQKRSFRNSAWSSYTPCFPPMQSISTQGSSWRSMSCKSNEKPKWHLPLQVFWKQELIGSVACSFLTWGSIWSKMFALVSGTREFTNPSSEGCDCDSQAQSWHQSYRKVQRHTPPTAAGKPALLANNKQQCPPQDRRKAVPLSRPGCSKQARTFPATQRPVPSPTGSPATAAQLGRPRAGWDTPKVLSEGACGRDRRRERAWQTARLRPAGASRPALGAGARADGAGPPAPLTCAPLADTGRQHWLGGEEARGEEGREKEERGEEPLLEKVPAAAAASWRGGNRGLSAWLRGKRDNVG